jgi:iron complex transport system substrate-binding protein
VSAVDSRGKTITLPRPARRVVCLIESALSGLYMLGAEETVVGVSTNVYDGPAARYYAALDARLRARSLPTPGNWDFVNVESVLALRPDLVVLWAQQGDSLVALEGLGVPCYAVFLRSFDEVLGEVRGLGALTGRTARAEELVTWARDALDVIEDERPRDAEARRPRAYFMWAQGDLETSGRIGLVEELLRRAGTRNVADGVGQEHVVVDTERLLAWDPELIVMWGTERRQPADVLGDPRWRRLAAVRSRRVHELPDVFLCDLWTLKLPYAVRLVSAWAYPGRTRDSDLVRWRDEMLATLYRGRLRGGGAP